MNEITVKEAATLLDVHPDTIKRYVEQGKLKRLEVSEVLALSSCASKFRLIRKPFDPTAQYGPKVLGVDRDNVQDLTIGEVCYEQPEINGYSVVHYPGIVLPIRSIPISGDMTQ
jgi:hypothetical protein